MTRDENKRLVRYFLAWLKREHGVELGNWDNGRPDCFWPTSANVDLLLDQFLADRDVSLAARYNRPGLEDE